MQCIQRIKLRPRSYDAWSLTTLNFASYQQYEFNQRNFIVRSLFNYV